MAYIPNSGSVAVLQSDPNKLVGTVSVVGGVSITNLPTTQNISGSVSATGSITALQGTNPWQVQLTSGSIATTGGNSSVMLTPGINTIGSVAALQATNPWIVQLTSGSIATTAGTTGNSSVQLVGGTAMIGSVATYQAVSPWVVGLTSGSVLVSNQSTGVSSVQLMAGTNVVGSVATLQGTSPWRTITSISGGITSVTQAGQWNMSPASVQLLGGTNTVGSVAVLQGTNPWVIGSNNNSILNAGTYIEDTAHTFGDRGTPNWGVRNDTMASVTTTDRDYTPFTVGSAGETIIANAPIIKWVSGVTSVMYGTSVTVLAAQGASIATYVTGIHLVNESANASRVTFTQGTGQAGGSVLLYAMAPATGGTNMQFSNPIKTIDNKQISASISGVSSVYVMLTGFIGNI